MGIQYTNHLAEHCRKHWRPQLTAGNITETEYWKELKAVEAQFPETHYVWRTAQHENGKISGMFHDSEERAAFNLAVTWGSPVVWIVDDPDCVIHYRYYDSAPARHRYDALFPVTNGPVDDPAPIPVTSPATNKHGQLSLFDF